MLKHYMLDYTNIPIQNLSVSCVLSVHKLKGDRQTRPLRFFACFPTLIKCHMHVLKHEI